MRSAYNRGGEAFIERLLAPHSHLKDGVQDLGVQDAAESLEVAPLFEDPERRCKFDIVFEGLLHAVPVLDTVVRVVLCDLLQEEASIQL